MAARSDARVLRSANPARKELLAAHVHKSSPFAGGPFGQSNCPPSDELIETELSDTKKGSFTGATAARAASSNWRRRHHFPGRSRRSARSFPGQLLRVLQEGEFHRVAASRLSM